jgi:hypothetical protein
MSKVNSEEPKNLVYEDWARFLHLNYVSSGLQEGYKLLYCPWRTIQSAETACISLNPGRAPANHEQEALSDERGNSYAIEASDTLSPMTAQFLKLLDVLQISSEEVLTGVVNPFRSANYVCLNRTQAIRGAEIGVSFWKSIIHERRLKRIICCSRVAGSILKKSLAINQVRTVRTGWANTLFRRIDLGNNQFMIELPHLSRYRLFSREECKLRFIEILNY